VINKIDLAEAVECDLDLLERNIRQVRPPARIFRLSAKRGQGMDAWLDYLRACRAAKRT
jgi:hydrogenase nickel incorporation protein HypB